MKYLITLAALMLLGCETNSNTPLGRFIIPDGWHPIVKLNPLYYGNHEQERYFSLCMSESVEEGARKPKMLMAWRTREGSLALNTIPLDKIRVILDADMTSPTVRLKVINSQPAWHKTNLQAVIDGYEVEAVIIKCREGDWPISLRIPNIGRLEATEDGEWSGPMTAIDSNIK